MSREEYIQRLCQQELERNSGCGQPMLMMCTVALIIFLLCSCASTSKVEYVDREVVKYEKQYIHDTTQIEKHDSVFYSIIQKGDTVYSTKYVEKTRWRDRVVVKSDTVFRDSIHTQIKEKTVEKQIIPKWCYFCLVVCAIFLIFAIRKLIRWLQII